MNTTEAKQNLEVVYIPRHLRGEAEQMQNRERGRISSWNDTYIFVRFGDDASGKACYPSDLEIWECCCGSLPKGNMGCVQHYIQ